MLGRTHIALGIVTTASIITNPKTLPISIAVAGISSLIPDIDEEHSLLRREIDIIPGLPLGLPILLGLDYLLWKLNYFSIYAVVIFAIYLSFAYFTKHRGFTHSVFGLASFMIILVLSNKLILIPATIGYCVHLIADMFSNSGIKLLYPLDKHFGIHILDTGSIFDRAVGVVAIGAFVIKLSNTVIKYDPSLLHFINFFNGIMQ